MDAEVLKAIKEQSDAIQAMGKKLDDYFTEKHEKSAEAIKTIAKSLYDNQLITEDVYNQLIDNTNKTAAE